MYLRRGHFERTARAPAKLNLYLEVFGRRADGFHELETLMVPVRLSDSLRMSRLPARVGGASGDITLDVHTAMPRQSSPPGSEIPCGNDNLVVRALDLLRERSGCRFGARVELVKRIPSAAGLGGGSSDAAAALRLANDLWDLNWPTARLSEVAAEIGSDVPFFLADGPALCRGRGESVEPVRGMRPLDFVIVKPPHDLSTADVYRAHAQMAKDGAAAAPANHQHDAASGRNSLDWMANRLQAAAASLSPWVERLRAVFDSLGFLRHQLSGSGSAYFGVCRHAAHARRLATILRVRQLGLVYATRSCG